MRFYLVFSFGFSGAEVGEVPILQEIVLDGAADGVESAGFVVGLGVTVAFTT